MGNNINNINDAKKWFKEAKFGMMSHFGLYSVAAGEWKGQRMGNIIGEWLQSYFRIPNQEYHELAKAFNPIYFNAEEWIKLAKEAGMKYFVITSKHHEGFALFRSKVSKFNSADGTPAHRDIIEECANACAKHDIKLGLYYSQAIDWSHPDGAGYLKEPNNCGFMSWDNDWDFPDKSKKDYTRCYNEKIKPQVEEILRNYGDLCLIWFDTPSGIPEACTNELYNMVKKYQPNCLVNSRLGNTLFDYQTAGDNKLPDSDKSDTLFESPGTLNDTWGYKSYDNNWKSIEKVKELKETINSYSANYLLNVGPDWLGRIPAPAIDILSKVNR